MEGSPPQIGTNSSVAGSNNSNTRVISDYCFDTQQRLGQGAYSKVFRGYSLNDPGKAVAVKVVMNRNSVYSEKLRESLQSEINTLRSFINRGRKNIVACYDVKVCPSLLKNK